MIKKGIKIILTIGMAIFLLSGCNMERQAMDKLAADGRYHYQNRSLRFALNLPPEFEYYQTQRKNTDYYIDMEFFVPTSDTAYPQEVPGYAKAILVRILGRQMWEAIEDDDEYKSIFDKVGEKGDRVYTIVFWDSIPTDWQEQWDEEKKREIIASFAVK